MPCDIGYRSVADGQVATETRTRAPEIDRDLLDKLGVDDPVFLAWAQELDIDPLLAKALERALAEISVDGDFRIASPGFAGARSVAEGRREVRIENGALISRSRNDVSRVTERWQLEVLRVVLELLDYDCAITDGVLEGEKHGASGVHEYVAIAFTAGGLALRFEHFASEDALAREQRKFLALAQRLGIRVRIVREKRAGQAIPAGAIHPHKHRGKA